MQGNTQQLKSTNRSRIVGWRRLAALSAVAIGALIGTVPAHAINDAHFKKVIAGLAQCERTKTGVAVNACVADTIDGAGARLVESGPVVVQTVQEVRAAPNKAAAISVLNRARSVMQGLSAKTAGVTQASYGLMTQVYARAISVINNKG